MMKDIDQNNDGTISYDEFKTLISGTFFNLSNKGVEL
jgi:Ca2+-binding EF-hand superfamily protein